MGTAFDEYARVFFSLVNEMYRLKAKESLNHISEYAAANGGADIVDQYKRQAEGNTKIIEQAKLLREIRNGK
jgi:hypothetical protein